LAITISDSISRLSAIINNVVLDLIEIGWDGVDWVGLPQERESGELL
jgi:hypothetical protein